MMRAGRCCSVPTSVTRTPSRPPWNTSSWRALDWRAILTSLTTAPAARFGYAGRKRMIKPGMDADLVVLDGDPAKDVAAFAKVQDTISDGRIIYAEHGG